MNVNIWQTPVEDLIPKGQKLITISHKESLPAAFRILTQNNIYGAPVVNLESGEYYGFLDLIDIVTFIVHLVCEDVNEGKRHKKYHSGDEDFYKLLEQVEKFDLERVVNVVDLSKRNPMVPVKRTAPVVEAINAFVKTGVHRVPIVEGNKVVNILTQSVVIDWLYHNMKALEERLDVQKTIQELQIGYKSVVQVTSHSIVLEAFKKMVDNNISAVAVVDPDGTLFTNVSAKDIKLIQPEALFTKLYRTTLEFVQAVRAKRIDTYATSIHCHENNTLKEVIAKLAAAKIHRVYLVNEQHHAVGVISLVDVMRCILVQLGMLEK